MQEIINKYGQDSLEGRRAIYALNLGAAAQRNVCHDTGDLANKNLTADQKQMTGWTSETAAKGGHLDTNSIWAVDSSEGTGRMDIIKNIGIAPEYDAILGFVIKVDSPSFGNEYTVQFCDSTGAVLQTFSSSEGVVDYRVTRYERKFYCTGGVVNIDDLAQEFRIKVFCGDEQQCYTVRFNFLWLIMNNSYNRWDIHVARAVYSLYETTLPNYVVPTV